MTPEFESRNHAQPEAEQELPHKVCGNPQQVSVDMKILKCDRFELLSAYLDGEVTATERHQVEQWLATEPETQCLYRRLLKLRHGCQTLPTPPTAQVEQTVQQVFRRIEHRRQRAIVWGGTAIAALFVGISTALNPPSLQVATQPQPIAAPASETLIGEPLMVALNTPVVKIPQASTLPRTLPPAEFEQRQFNNKLN